MLTVSHRIFSHRIFPFLSENEIFPFLSKNTTFSHCYQRIRRLLEIYSNEKILFSLIKNGKILANSNLGDSKNSHLLFSLALENFITPYSFSLALENFIPLILSRTGKFCTLYCFTFLILLRRGNFQTPLYFSGYF